MSKAIAIVTVVIIAYFTALENGKKSVFEECREIGYAKIDGQRYACNFQR